MDIGNKADFFRRGSILTAILAALFAGLFVITGRSSMLYAWITLACVCLSAVLSIFKRRETKLHPKDGA